MNKRIERHIDTIDLQAERESKALRSQNKTHNVHNKRIRQQTEYNIDVFNRLFVR